MKSFDGTKTKTMMFAERYWKNHGYEFELKRQYITTAHYLVGKDGMKMKFNMFTTVADNPAFMRSFEETFGLFKKGVENGLWKSEE